MTRHLFIGSSSEGLPIAEKLKQILEAKFPDFLNCKIWTDGKIFSLNKSTLDSLVKASRKFDYGILVATADDIRIRTHIHTLKRTKSHVPRDNVMFEMGMFIGSLGLTRAFLLVEKTTTLPTDYSGVTVPYYEKDVAGSLEIAIDKIVAAISNTKNSYNLKPIPAAALALSYFDNFIQPLAKQRLKNQIKFTLSVILPPNIKDIKTSIAAYSAKHKSEEISVFNDEGRPRVFKLLGKKHTYWDMPTTLSTLHKLINFVNPSTEIGIEQDKEDWIKHELRNFKGTIEVLIQECEACKGNITVSFQNSMNP